MQEDISEVHKNENGLYCSKNGMPLTNAVISVRRENVITTNNEESIYIIEVYERGHRIMHKPFFVLSIDKILKEIPFYIFNANTIKDRRNILQKIIGEEILSNPIQDVHKYMTGFHMSDDKNLIYLSDSTTYGNVADKTVMSINSEKMTLYTPHPTITDAFKFVEKFLSRPMYAALFVAAISSYIDPYLKFLDIKQKICVVVISETAFGKSSYCSLLTRHGNTKRECSFFEDKKDFFKTLASHRDCPVLVEELSKTVSDSVRRKNEKLFAEMIHKYESNKSFLLDGQSLQFSATPIVTGEYMVKNPSTINRCLVIEFTEKFDPKELSWLQSHQEYYDVFLDKFIDWICKSYEKYKREIPNWTFKSLKVECEDSYTGSLHRSQNIYKILNMTIKILMDFFNEVYNLPHSQLKELRSIMEAGVDESMYSTIERLKKEDAQCGAWYTNVVLDYLFYNYTNVVAKDYEEYLMSQSKTKRKLFFEAGGYICISADDITKCFAEHKSNKYVVTTKAILSQLGESGLIHSTDGHNTQFVYVGGQRIDTRFVKILKTEFEERVSERQMNVYANPFPAVNFWGYIYNQ